MEPTEPMQSPSSPPVGGKKSPMTGWVAAIILLLVVGVGYAAMRGKSSIDSQMSASPSPTMSQKMQIDGDGDEPAMSPDAGDQMSASPTPGSTTSDATVQTITVTGKNFLFIPSSITVKKGQKVKIVFQNEGGTHDWVIDEFNAHTTRIQGGQSTSLEFTPDKTGTFEFYCSVGTHRQMGMKGNLIVQ